MNFNYIFLIAYAWGLNSTLSHGMVEKRPRLISTHLKRFSPYNKVPARLQKESLMVYYNTPLAQCDDFSCGHRVLFHAECLEKAAQQAKEDKDLFMPTFQESAKDEKRLSKIYHKISRYLKYIDPKFDQFATGLCDFHLAGISQKKLRLLKEKIIPIKVFSDEIWVLHNPVKSKHPLLFSDEFLKDSEFETFDRSTCYQPLQESPEFAYQLERLKSKKPFVFSHFGCLCNGHWILASLFNNFKGRTRIAFMDSQNLTFEDNVLMAVIQKKFLPYIHTLNGN